jgi:hypothetical protein
MRYVGRRRLSGYRMYEAQMCVVIPRSRATGSDERRLIRSAFCAGEVQIRPRWSTNFPNVVTKFLFLERTPAIALCEPQSSRFALARSWFRDTQAQR